MFSAKLRSERPLAAPCFQISNLKLKPKPKTEIRVGKKLRSLPVLLRLLPVLLTHLGRIGDL